MQLHFNDIEFIKKTTVLRILKKKGESEAMRLYPEYTNFILRVRGMNEDEIKEVFKEEDYMMMH